MDYKLAQDIIEAIDTRIDIKMPEFNKYNYYLYGYITNVISSDTYEVKINDSTWTLKGDKTYVKNDLVCVLVPNGNKNEAFRTVI
jgi:membrane protein implicated in regulation of membrane protease activity